MTTNGSCFGSSSFSVATTVFVSLAICAVVSYGVFYYFKQRISVIEQSQMEQARVMQAFIARSIMHPLGNPANLNQMNQVHPVHKEVNITESGLIEVSSDSESDDGSESESTTSESSDYDNDSGSSDSEHAPEHDHDHDHAHEHATKCIQIQLSSDDVAADSVSAEKKIISLNKTALKEASESESDNESESSSDHEDPQDGVFELNIGYKKENTDAKKTQSHSQSQSHAIQLNYGNMSVPALRQLAKERGLVGDDGDLQKLKKKELMQLLQ